MDGRLICGLVFTLFGVCFVAIAVRCFCGQIRSWREAGGVVDFGPAIAGRLFWAAVSLFMAAGSFGVLP